MGFKVFLNGTKILNYLRVQSSFKKYPIYEQPIHMYSLSSIFWLSSWVPYPWTWYFPLTNFLPFPGQTILGVPIILKGTKPRGRKQQCEMYFWLHQLQLITFFFFFLLYTLFCNLFFHLLYLGECSILYTYTFLSFSLMVPYYSTV